VPAQFWTSNVNAPGIGAGNALADSASATDISPAPQYTLPANTMYVGQRWRLTAHGILSTASSGNPTLTLGFYYAGVAGTALLTTGAVNVGANSLANAPWRIWADVEVRTIGSSGTTWANGMFSNPTALATCTITPMPATQTQPITVNTTTANAITCGATWGSAVSGTSITCEGMIVELLN
jgi:hypothetical protein